MMVTSLVAVVVSCTGKTIKNGANVFDRGENLLQNGILRYSRVPNKRLLLIFPWYFNIFRHSKFFFGIRTPVY